MWQSIEQHLRHRYGGEKVTLVRIEHRPPLADEFESGEQTLTHRRFLCEAARNGAGRGAMNPLLRSVTDWINAVARGWDRFWFTPALPHALALIRILAARCCSIRTPFGRIDLDDFWVGKAG